MTKTFYIVIDKENKKHMLAKRSSRSATNQELSNKGAPRLFTTKLAAQNAISWWKSGKWGMYRHSTWDEPQDWFLDVIKMPERDKIKLIIHPVKIDLGYFLEEGPSKK